MFNRYLDGYNSINLFDEKGNVYLIHPKENL